MTLYKAALLMVLSTLWAWQPPAPGKPTVAASQTSAYPDATNTGYVHTGVSLTTYSSPCTITVAGTTIDSKNITCEPLLIRANNVTVKRSRLTLTGDGTGICNDCDAGGAFTNLLVEDVEINCANKGGSTAISARNYTARRVNAYGCENTMWADSNVTIEDSYLHDNVPAFQTPDCYNPGGGDTDPCHTDGIQIPEGSSITINHNRVHVGSFVVDGDMGSGAIGMAQNSASTNITINNNIIAGGSYAVHCGTHASTSYTNNRFSTVYAATVGEFGLWYSSCGSSAGTFSGNVCHESGVAVTRTTPTCASAPTPPPPPALLPAAPVRVRRVP